MGKNILLIGGSRDGKRMAIPPLKPDEPYFPSIINIPLTDQIVASDFREQYKSSEYMTERYRFHILGDSANRWFIYAAIELTESQILEKLLDNYNPKS